MKRINLNLLLKLLFLNSNFVLTLGYRKIPKISPGAYIFQRPFARGLFVDGLIFGGTYVRRELCVSKSIGLVYSWKEINRFCFILLCIWGQFSKYKPPGSLFSEFYGILTQLWTTRPWVFSPRSQRKNANIVLEQSLTSLVFCLFSVLSGGVCVRCRDK